MLYIVKRVDLIIQQVRSHEVHYVENHHHSYYINFKSVICTYTLFFTREKEYREIKQNRRGKHKDINDMLDSTILTI